MSGSASTGLAHTLLIYMIESQVADIIEALRHLRRTEAAAVEIRPQAQVGYWYLDPHGQHTTLGPTFTCRFHRATRWSWPAECIAHQHVAQPVPV